MEVPPGEKVKNKKNKQNEVSFSQERRELLDAGLEKFLLTKTEKINEGNNGVVFKFNQKTILEHEELFEFFRFDPEKKEESAVVKILKLYFQGQGLKEFKMQQKAYELVQSSEEKELAEVPEPINYYDLKISSQELKNFLKNRGVRETDNIELLIMDFVPGEDLSTRLFKEVIKRHPKLAHLKNQVEEMKKYCEVALDYRYPGEKSRDEGEREFEREKLFAENMGKMVEFLKSRGFVLDKRILDRYKKTIDLFHENGLLFRDGHHRNLMVNGEGDDLEVQVIDFGSSTEFEGEYESSRDFYTDPMEGRAYIQDEMIYRSLLPLTEKKKTVGQESQEKFFKQINTIGKRLKQREKNWQALLTRSRERVDNPENLFIQLYQSDPYLKNLSMDNRVDGIICLFQDMVNQGILEKEKLIEFLDQAISNPAKIYLSRPADVNKLVEFRKSL